MDSADRPALRPLPPQFDVGAAAVVREEAGVVHAGLLYAHAGAFHFLHLGWEDRLHRIWQEPGFWVVPAVDPEVLSGVGMWCRRVWAEFERTRKFTYGLGLDAVFDADGRVVSCGTPGMTCATIIMKIFERAGQSLIREPQAWSARRDEDLVWLALLGSRFPGSAVVTRLGVEIQRGTVRIRPEEVVGACLHSPLPAEEGAAKRGAKEVLQQLRGDAGGDAAPDGP